MKPQYKLQFKFTQGVWKWSTFGETYPTLQQANSELNYLRNRNLGWNETNSRIIKLTYKVVNEHN